MTKTANDVVKRALTLIKIVAAGEEPDSDSHADALTEYTATHARIMADMRDKYRVAGGQWDKDRVPDEAFPLVSRILAQDLMSVFPVDDSVVPMAAQAMADLGKIYSRRKKSATRFPDMPTTTSWNGWYSSGIND